MRECRLKENLEEAMERALDTSLRDWKLELLRTIRGQPRAEWGGMDSVQRQREPNEDWLTLAKLESYCGLGDVFKQVSDNHRYPLKLRAVKRIRKSRDTENSPALSYRELMALATFSVQKTQDRSQVSTYVYPAQ